MQFRDVAWFAFKVLQLHFEFIGLARTIHIYTVYIRYFWQGHHQTHGRVRCMYTVLANPKN
jgi:hypothetical protein